MDFFKNLIPFPSIKLPKLKKLRQWSQGSLLSLNLSQLTGWGNNRNNSNNNNNNSNSNNNYNYNNNSNNNNNSNHKLRGTSNSYDDNIITVSKGISTISGAILDQKIDPKKDNFGLYALKCDRSSSLANAKRGILLTLPSTKLRTRAEINLQQSVVERTHELFESCENNEEAADSIMYDGATSSASVGDGKVKIEPPPRKKKRQTATKHLMVHQKMLKKSPVPPPKAIIAKDIRKAEESTLRKDSFDIIESGLYRIVNTQAPEKAKVSVEDAIGKKKKEHVVTMVKPKVQKAIVVKATPLPRQITKVKSIESNKSVKSVNSNKVQPKKCYTPSESGISQQTSVDIFKPSHSVDQKQVFDEFDSLFDKSRQASEDIPAKKESSAFTAFQKLNELKFSSSSFSSESSNKEKQVEVDTMELGKCSISSIKTQDFYKSNLPRVQYLNSLLNTENDKPLEECTKPRIISEQPKVLPTSYTTQKVIYYDDKNDFLSYQQLILNQNQSTTIINNHFTNSQLLPAVDKMITIPSTDNIDNDNNKLMKTDDKVPIKSILTTKLSSTSDAIATDYNDEDTVSGNYEDLRNNNNNFNNNTSNSLRIFSNEGVFVFNL